VKNLEKRIVKSIKNKIPFVLFRKPNQTIGKAYFQQDNDTYFSSNFSKNGFVFAPFDAENKTLFIPFSITDEFTFKTEKSTPNLTSKIKSNASKLEKNKHIKLVQNGIDFMNATDVKKVVLSRKEMIEIDDFDVFQVYNRLLENYPTAYVYLWFHPSSGLWMGATPEVLLKVKNQKFNVMALAATQEYKGNLDVVWSDKEKQEHQFVVDYIVSKFGTNSVKISKTHTVKAGNLVHLRADIFGEINNSKNELQKLIKTLHPTPATCGLPKEKAKEFIIKNEGYNREFYTGFLGEINGRSADLYVNLRCMKVDILHNAKNDKIKGSVSLYIGGGITKESNPQLEWHETVAKSNVMKKVL